MFFYLSKIDTHWDYHWDGNKWSRTSVPKLYESLFDAKDDLDNNDDSIRIKVNNVLNNVSNKVEYIEALAYNREICVIGSNDIVMGRYYDFESFIDSGFMDANIVTLNINDHDDLEVNISYEGTPFKIL